MKDQTANAALDNMNSDPIGDVQWLMIDDLTDFL